MAAFVTHHVGVRVEGGLVFRKATCTTRSMRSFRSHCPVRMSVEEDKATTNEAESEKKPSPSLIPMQQGSVPVQTGAQADMLAVKRKPKETEEEESAKVDPIQAAKDEIASLTEIPELTDEQKMRIKRMKKKVTRAAAIQESQGFSDAWSQQNAGRQDVWFYIGLIFLLTPLAVLAWGVWSGEIPIFE